MGGSRADPILGYEKWQNAEEVIGRAAKASINSGQAVDNHFTVFSKKGELLDRAGTTELAANLFRITQTDEKIQKDNIQGENDATRTHFMVGGKVRQTIKDIGGTLPENLPTEKHIRELKSGKRKLLKEKDKKQAE